MDFHDKKKEEGGRDTVRESSESLEELVPWSLWLSLRMYKKLNLRPGKGSPKRNRLNNSWNSYKVRNGSSNQPK